MPRRTFADVKASRIPQALGICNTDARLLAFVNEAQERLLNEGLWWGTYGKFRICATEGCLTLPPQLATLEAVAICGQPVPIHDELFEFLDNGMGTRQALSNAINSTTTCCGSGACGIPEALARGQFPTFSDVQGVDKQVRLVCDRSTDVGKQVLVLGYDENSNWIRTSQSGVIADGEVITLAQSPGTTSTNYFSAITGIQFPSNMDGQTWMYEFRPSDSNLRLISTYQYWETRPSYARYFFPSIMCQAGTGCQTVTVEVIGKLAFIPVVKDTDYLLISNLPALKEMCVGLNRAENEPDNVRANQIILSATAIAKRLLDQELDQYLGHGRRMGINFQGSSVGEVVPVETFI